MSRGTILVATLVCILLACLVPATVCAQGEAVFRFAILSDRTGGHTNGVYPRVIEAINQQKPDLVVTVGDHIEGYGDDYDRAEAEWDTLLAMLRVLEAPVHMTPGNHDIWDGASEALYLEKTGRQPFYSFDHENSHFVILDNSRIESWTNMGGRQFGWLLADLRNTDADNVFVFFHKPLWDQTLRRGESDRLHDILTQNGVDAVFCGHYHRFFSGDFDGIEYTAIGSSGASIDGEPSQPELTGEFFQYAVVSVLSDGYELTVHQLDGDGVYSGDFVTVDLLDELEHIQGDLVDVSPLMVSGAGGTALPLTLSIENETPKTMDGKAEWSVPEQWKVEPAAESFSIPPGSTREFGFTATRGGDIYPAPAVSFEYPLSDGRSYEIERAARVVRKIGAPRVSEAPAIDGQVDDSIRNLGTSVTELYTGSGYSPVEGDTEFLFANDGTSLLVTAVCHEERMEELAASAGEHDAAVYLDDCVGFFFQPDPEDLVVYQVYVNADGVVFDQKITFDENMWWTAHPEWNGEYQIATSRADDKWTAEIAIPFAALGADHSDGGTWRLNFRRKQQRTSASADWQVPIDYNPLTFGEIDLE